MSAVRLGVEVVCPTSDHQCYAKEVMDETGRARELTGDLQAELALAPYVGDVSGGLVASNSLRDLGRRLPSDLDAERAACGDKT